MSLVSLVVGNTFVPFGAAHWVVIIVVAAATVLLSRILRRAAGRPHEAVLRRTVCWSLAAVLVAGAVAGQVHRVAIGAWSLRESLPLHLCDIALFVVAAALLGAGLKPQPDRVWQRLYELAYVWGIGGTSQAVLTPDIDDAFPSPACLRYFMIHGGIIVGVLIMTIGLRMRPQSGTVRRVWLVTFVLAVVVMLVDWVLEANYMYLCGPPAHPSLYDAFGRWPWSLIPLAVVGTFLIALTYSPFWLLDRGQAKRALAKTS